MHDGILIGVTGKARSGKDTFSEMLAEEFYNTSKTRFVLMAYAQELKLRVQRDFDLTYDQLWGDKKEVPDKRYYRRMTNWAHEEKPYTDIHWTPREIMQSYGEFFRGIDTQFWVNNLFRVIEEKEYRNVIVTDVRHPNEATPIIDRNGFIIKVTSERTEKEQIHGASHISEVAMDNFEHIDFHVKNDEGLDELRQTAKTVATFITEAVRTKFRMEAKNG
jgi:adenosyl cobinamide kinase/adenosyl cobinamide phosphate guanylyltransferase